MIDSLSSGKVGNKFIHLFIMILIVNYSLLSRIALANPLANSFSISEMEEMADFATVDGRFINIQLNDKFLKEGKINYVYSHPSGDIHKSVFKSEFRSLKEWELNMGMMSADDELKYEKWEYRDLFSNFKFDGHHDKEAHLILVVKGGLKMKVERRDGAPSYNTLPGEVLCVEDTKAGSWHSTEPLSIPTRTIHIASIKYGCKELVRVLFSRLRKEKETLWFDFNDAYKEIVGTEYGTFRRATATMYYNQNLPQ